MLFIIKLVGQDEVAGHGALLLLGTIGLGGQTAP